MGIDCSQFLRRPARGYSSKSGLRKGAFQATMVAGQANVYRHQHPPVPSTRNPITAIGGLPTDSLTGQI